MNKYTAASRTIPYVYSTVLSVSCCGILYTSTHDVLHMTLQEQIRADMVVAMKAKEEVRLSVLRGLLTLFTNELTATKRTPQDKLTDDEVLALIRRALKQRKEAADQYRNGGRPELAHNEEIEAKVLETYLPQMMNEQEIETIVRQKMTDMRVVDTSGMGKLIGAVMSVCNGRAEGAQVKKIIESLLK